MLYNQYRHLSRQLCGHARTFVDIADRSVFSQITEFTTPAQFDLALQNLKALAERLEAQVDLFHYGQAHGTLHSCVRDIYDDAEFRLKNLAIMHQKIQEPPPKQQLITTEGTVIDLEDRVQTSSTETDTGTEDDASHGGSTG
jgi:hypothetical protein